MTNSSWLSVTRGEAPMLVSMPHTGTDLAGLEDRVVSPWLGRCDADWWIDRLYDFVTELGATVIHTSISRTVIDVNRDPSGASLYPGMATTELCPTTTFDGIALYKAGEAPGPDEIARRRDQYFEPYHAALRLELARLRTRHDRVVLYDCHSIRSVIPRLFDGTLPVFNLGTNSGASCDPELSQLVEGRLEASGLSFVVNGRFKGGSITRGFGRPSEGVHALQMELACRGYMREAGSELSERTWPTPYDPEYAAPMRAQLREILEIALEWARDA
jgi:N-formylglutamate deformylase